VKLLDERVVERAREAGLDVLVYAPHFTRLADVRERAKRFSTDEVTVVPGREVFTGSDRPTARRWRRFPQSPVNTSRWVCRSRCRTSSPSRRRFRSSSDRAPPCSSRIRGF
jgi:hypothetical protein